MRDPKVLTTSDVARRLHVTPSTVFRWIKAGWLKSSPTAGRHNRIREEDLRQFMQDRGMLPTTDSGPIRVFIADGQASTVAHLAALVRSASEDCKIETSQDGYDALIKIGSFSPHIVIIYDNTPYIQSERACRAIRAIQQLKSARIIVISSEPDPAEQALLNAGADSVLKSPFSPDQFLEEVCQLAPGFFASELTASNRARLHTQQAS